MTEAKRIDGLILAGGRGVRMGGAKALLPVAGQPMVAHVWAAMQGQVDQVWVSANGDAEAFQQWGEVVADAAEFHLAGPLAGIAAVMERTVADYLLILPCDTPLIRPALVAALCQAPDDGARPVCVADDEGRMHPLFLRIPVALRASVQRYLLEGGRAVHRFLQQHQARVLPYDAAWGRLANVNTPGDLSDANQ